MGTARVKDSPGVLVSIPPSIYTTKYVQIAIPICHIRMCANYQLGINPHGQSGNLPELRVALPDPEWHIYRRQTKHYPAFAKMLSTTVRSLLGFQPINHNPRLFAVKHVLSPFLSFLNKCGALSQSLECATVDTKLAVYIILTITHGATQNTYPEKR